MSGAPNIIGTTQFPKPPIMIGVSSSSFIGPRWLMPRMYCSHIDLLYYP